MNESEKRAFNEKLHEPLQVGYNPYKNFLWCRNSNQIKIFSVKDGELTSLYPALFEDSHSIHAQ